LSTCNLNTLKGKKLHESKRVRLELSRGASKTLRRVKGHDGITITLSYCKRKLRKRPYKCRNIIMGMLTNRALFLASRIPWRSDNLVRGCLIVRNCL
jgi:hypothetical protein